MKNTLLTLLFASYVVGVVAQNANKIDFVEYTLDNGLHVILHEDHSTPIVAVSIMYHVGSKNEDTSRTGFAHFFEHLLFEGSKYIERGEISNYIENAGGTLNANTSQDRTYYYEILPSNQLELGLWIESERLLHAKVDNKGVETQRQVIKEESRMRYENRPYGTVIKEVMKRAYTQHPYSWTPIGSMAHLEAATEADYKSFYKKFYVPKNACLSIAGDLDIEQTKKLIKMYFGDIPSGEMVKQPEVVEPPLKKEIRDVIYDNVQLPAVVMGYRIPAQGTDDFYAVDMLATLLARGESSRLNKSLVDQKQVALATGSSPLPTEHPGVNLAFGICNVGVSVEDLEKAMEEEIVKAQTELISEKEFMKLRNQIENDFVSSNSTIIGIAESLANYHMYFGDASLINNEINRYLNVNREDIRAVAKKYFNKDNRVLLYWLPKPKG